MKIPAIQLSCEKPPYFDKEVGFWKYPNGQEVVAVIGAASHEAAMIEANKVVARILKGQNGLAGNSLHCSYVKGYITEKGFEPA